MSGLGASARSASRVGWEITTSPAAVSQPSVMRRSRASEASAEDSGIPAARCNASGRKGVGRAASGQASALNPMTQRWSNSQPADSSTPRTWIGTSGDSGWKEVSAAMRRSRATASPWPILGTTRSSCANWASTACHFLSAWYSVESSARPPGNPTSLSASENARPHSDGDCTPNKRSLRNSASRASSCTRPGASPCPPASIARRSSVRPGSARRRKAASRRARCASSSPAPAINGERTSALARSNVNSRPVAASTSNAASTSG